MSEVRFEVSDVAEIRFCVSPLWETVTSMWALTQPGRHAIHLPWIKTARPLARRRDLAGHVELLTAFARPRAWLPDFLTPPPASPLQDICEELATVLASPPEEVRRDILVTEGSGPLAPLARVVADDPEGMVPRLVAAVRAWHDAAIRPHWPRMRALLEADIAYRARQLAAGGARQLFDTLHPAAHWDGDRLVIADRWTQSLTVSGRGFPLMPSVFADKAPLISCSNEAAPGAVYPARAVGTLWEGLGRPGPGATDGDRADALSGVVGSARARLLELLRAPGTTSDLAHRTGLSVGAVSQQLGLLYEARLVQRNRQGRAVYYLCTELGLALLDGVF
ncbi:ArsR family transcriptional regulator [Dactylosporangium sp. NPDC048998]|uniref:ArsR family transcriptional regulator n=1 Tax=Dactylosporangium sp. NPDC048998 TaxID=3363976 RepID=UPI0037102BEF